MLKVVTPNDLQNNKNPRGYQIILYEFSKDVRLIRVGLRINNYVLRVPFVKDDNGFTARILLLRILEWNASTAYRPILDS